MTTPYLVVWDGRKDGPGSAYLVARPETPQPAYAQPPQTRPEPFSARVTAALQAQPQTARELGAGLGVTAWKINGALHNLKRRHAVRVVALRPMTERAYGRTAEHVYALVTP